MKLAFAEQFSGRGRSLRLAPEIGVSFNRGDAVPTQFELASHAVIERVQVAPIRENRLHPYITSHAPQDVAQYELVAAVPAADKYA